MVLPSWVGLREQEVFYSQKILDTLANSDVTKVSPTLPYIALVLMQCV